MKLLTELVLLLAVFGGLPFDVMSDTAYAVTPSLRVNGIDSTNVSYPTGNLRLQLGNVGGTSGYGILESLTPTDANGAATWYDTVVGTLFFGTKRDWVRDIGWNLTANGGRVDTADAAIGDQWESHYDADGTHSWVERHVVFIGTDGTYQRPWTLQVARTASANPIGYTNFGLAADNLWISGSATSSTQNFVFLNPLANAAGTLNINNSTQIRLNTNNASQLVQVNAAGNATYSLINVDGANLVNVCDTGTTCQVKGTTTTIDASGAVQIAPNASNTNIGGGTNYVQFFGTGGIIDGSPTATSGSQTKSAPTITQRSAYWTGAVSSNVDANLTHVMDSTTPTSHLQLQIGGSTMINWTSGGAVAQRVGASIASATTIAPLAAITHITGTTTIQTITAPNTFASSGMGGQVTLVFDGVAPWNAAGNIFVAGTPTTAGTAVIFTYDNATSKWYPSRTL